jgi:thiamine biosynthesis protein ThiI
VVSEAMLSVVLVRYGEVTLKGFYVRSRMERLLAKHVEFRLRRCGFNDFDVVLDRGRIFVYVDRAVDAAKCLTKVFGVVSVSPAVEVDNDIDVIKDYATRLALDAVKGRKIQSFAIRARRVESYPITSKDIEKIVGQVVKDSTGLRVDLEKPDLEVFIEVRERSAYIFTEVFKGPGGLPYGVEGRCVALYSGGVDSTVAMWMTAKRGCDVTPIHMVSKPFYSDKAYERAVEVLKVFRDWIPKEEFKALFVTNYGELLKRVIEVVERRLTCLACKRLMLLIASRVAEEVNAKAIVTGDSLGQVASQTLDNLYVISKGIRIPVFRPLIGFDKEEIASLARSLGFEKAMISLPPCAALPEHPETHAEPDALDKYSDFLEKLSQDAVWEEMIID